jgi:hypothetical protein
MQPDYKPTHAERTLEAAELYLSRQPVHVQSASGEPLWSRGQMLRAFYAGQLAVIDDKAPSPIDHVVGSNDPVAQFEFARGTLGRENEMPRVLSCNWLPDGTYSVYLAPPAQTVKVNSLDWQEETQYLEMWRARPECGLVFTVEDDGFSASKYRASVGHKVIGYFDNLDDAKVAAQSDFEMRIRAALAATSTGGTE